MYGPSAVYNWISSDAVILMGFQNVQFESRHLKLTEILTACTVRGHQNCIPRQLPAAACKTSLLKSIYTV